MGTYQGLNQYLTDIYTLETTDPVQGGASGVSNTPIKNLADRTAWNKQAADSVARGLAYGNNIARIWGAEVTVTGAGPFTYTLTEGAIYYNGVIYPVPAFSDTDASNILVFTVTDMGGYDALVPSLAVGGTGDFDYTEIKEIFDTPFVDATVINGWSSGAGSERLRYRFLENGNVQIKGRVFHNGTATSSIFSSLPAGTYPRAYRPVFESIGLTIDAIQLQANGDLFHVLGFDGAANQEIYIDEILYIRD